MFNYNLYSPQYCSSKIKNNKTTNKQLRTYTVTILHSKLSDMHV